MEFDCVHCSQRISAPDACAGQTVECPTCAGQITVPDCGNENCKAGAVPPKMGSWNSNILVNLVWTILLLISIVAFASWFVARNEGYFVEDPRIAGEPLTKLVRVIATSISINILPILSCIIVLVVGLVRKWFQNKSMCAYRTYLFTFSIVWALGTLLYYNGVRTADSVMHSRSNDGAKMPAAGSAKGTSETKADSSEAARSIHFERYPISVKLPAGSWSLMGHTVDQINERATLMNSKSVIASITVDYITKPIDFEKHALGLGLMMFGLEGNRPDVLRQKAVQVGGRTFEAYRVNAGSKSGKTMLISVMYLDLKDKVVKISFGGEKDGMNSSSLDKEVLLSAISFE